MSGKLYLIVSFYSWLVGEWTRLPRPADGVSDVRLTSLEIRRRKAEGPAVEGHPQYELFGRIRVVEPSGHDVFLERTVL